jgi:hypothetical protein
MADAALPNLHIAPVRVVLGLRHWFLFILFGMLDTHEILCRGNGRRRSRAEALMLDQVVQEERLSLGMWGFGLRAIRAGKQSALLS